MAKVPFQPNYEETIGHFGSVRVTWRQAVYLAAAAYAAYAAFTLTNLLPPPLRLPAYFIFAGPVTLLALAAAILFAFVPAGFLGIVPGPQSGLTGDPRDAPMRLETWLTIWLSHLRKQHRLPWRRRKGDGAGLG